MKDLTSSVYSFEDLIQGDFLYVDKTEYIWQLIRPAKEMYFLSRPRRFGKSLTLSTLKSVFEGKKELFKGLAIYDKPYSWEKHPIIHLDMNGRDFGTLEKMEDSFRHILMEQAEMNGVVLSDAASSTMFHKLIQMLHDRDGDVVVLLDEYDKPILNNIAKENVSDFLAALKVFYSVIKEKSGMLRLAFITGVSKFCHVSLFSDLNNLTDITMDARFATMLGYTQEEFEANFREQIKATEKKRSLDHAELLKQIKDWYDGFRFHAASPSVYNPVSLAKFFEHGGEFNNYWFETGTPTFLLDLIMKSKFDFCISLNKPVATSFFSSFEVTSLDPLVLLFQTGYLTIDRAERKQVPFTDKTVMEYYLRFPNFEVEESFHNSLLAYCTSVRKQDSQELILNLITAVGTGDANGFLKQFKTVFANIPYTIHVKDEHYYQTVFYVVCDLLNLMVEAEICTNDGRIDMMVAAGEWIYVIEFKLNKTAGEALKQIENKDYAQKYRRQGKRIMLLGVNFDFQAGQITDWLKEEIQ